jgi:hypothetical protein
MAEETGKVLIYLEKVVCFIKEGIKDKKIQKIPA